MSDTNRAASFAVEPVIVPQKSGDVLRGFGWCAKVIWQDGSVERLLGFSSSEQVQAWIKGCSGQWMREQS
jgi:hypothetical protein